MRVDRLDRQRIFPQHPGRLSGRNLARRPFQENQRNPRMGVGRSYSLFAAAGRGMSIFAQTAGSSWLRLRGKQDANKVSPKQEAVMKEADLFRQFAKLAMRWSSSKFTSADEKRALINLACRYAQAALMSEGVVLGSSFIPSPRRPTLKETHPVVFDLFMNDTCPRCRKPIKLAVIEQHPTRRDLASTSSTARTAGV
jgi:hypothetical protein